MKKNEDDMLKNESQSPEQNADTSAEDNNAEENNPETSDNDGTAADNKAGKTFTQDELNKIIGERLAREQSKNKVEQDAALATREAELHARELNLIAREELNRLGLPGELANVIKAADETELRNNIAILNKYINNGEDTSENKGFKMIGAPTGGGMMSQARRSMGLPPIV